MMSTKFRALLFVVGIVIVVISYIVIGRGFITGSPLEVILGGLGLATVSITAKTLK